MKVIATLDASELERVLFSFTHKARNKPNFIGIAKDSNSQINGTKATARKLLEATDFMPLRHQRQKDIGKPTSLSDDEFLAIQRFRDDLAKEVKAED